MSESLKKSLLIVGLIVGTIFQSLPVIRSGLIYSYGYGFWGPSGHDGIWHLSLINHISNPFVIEHPTISGQKLTNYHPFYDILISTVSKITQINTINLNFQITPIILSFLLIVLSYILGKKLFSSRRAGIYLAFLNIASGSMGWIYSLIANHTLGGESVFWSMQSFSNQLNPPYALSLIILLLFILLLINKKFTSLIIIIGVLMPITKSYGAVIFYVIFALYVFFEKKYYKLLFISLVLSLVVFLYYNPLSGQLFIWQPFWFVNSMLNSPDRLFIPKLASFINTSIVSKQFGLRFIIVEILGLILFLLGNFSWRILAFIRLPKSNNLIRSLLISIFICTLIPLLFIQKGTPWNTIQFLYYSLFISNIFLASFLARYQNKLLFLVIFVTTIISNIDNFKGTIGNPAPASLSISEYNALTYLKNQKGNIVVSYPYNKFLKQNISSTPIPLFAYETSAYVSAFSYKDSYLEDEMNLSISGYNYQERRQKADNFFSQKNKFEDRGFLINNQIDYIYIADKTLQNFTPDQVLLGIALIYDKNNILIYRVNR